MPSPQFAALGQSVEDVVVEYLRTAEPSRRSPSVESALELYISRLDEASQNHILPGWVRLSEIYERAGPTNSKKRKRKPSGNDKESSTEDKKLRKLQQQALEFLNQKERERALAKGKKMKPVDPELMKERIAALRSGQQWHDGHKIGEMWSSRDQAEPPQTATPVQRLTILYNGVSSSADLAAFKLRTLKLLWLHECQQARIKISERESKTMEEKTGMRFGKAVSVDKTARGWLMLIDVWGIGGLFMPAPGQCSLFERDLTKDQIEDLWAFCAKYMSDIKVKVENMRETALRLFVEAVDKYGGDAGTLETGGSRLATAYRTNGSLFEHDPSVETSNRSGDTCPSLEACPENTAFDTQAHIHSTQFRADSSRTLPPGLQVLTDAIVQVDSSCPESAPNVGQDQSTQDTQTQQQFGTRNEGLLATTVDGRERGIFVPGSHHQPRDSQAWTSGVSRPTTRLNLDTLGVQSEGTSTGQVPGPAAYGAGPISSTTHGQSMQSPWQMHADPRSAAMSGASTSSCMPSATTGQAQAHEPGSTSGNSQHGLAVGTQARGQSLPGASNEGLTLGQVPRLASNEMESVAAATYGRVPPSLWQTYAYQNCPQQVPVDPFPPGGAQNPMASEVPLDDTFRLSQTHLDRSDMAIRQDGGGFWPEAWLDDLAQAGGFST